MKKLFMVILLIVLVLLSLITGQVNAGKCPPGEAEVTLEVEIPNNTGQNANDLHVEAYQKEQGVAVNSGTISSNRFSNVTTNLVQGNFHNDGQNHQLNGDLSGGNVANGAHAKVAITLCLTKRNQMWLRYTWTSNANNIGGGGPFGTDVRDPIRGNTPGDPCSQEGYGGSGYYDHIITIFNDANKPIQLDDLYILASMTYYQNLSDISWASVPAVITDPVTIPANGSWTYTFPTTGSYVGGHMYLKYTIIDDEIQIIFDHPVEEPTIPEDTPTLSEWGLIILAALLLAAGAIVIVRRRRRVAA